MVNIIICSNLLDSTPSKIQICQSEYSDSEYKSNNTTLNKAEKSMQYAGTYKKQNKFYKSNEREEITNILDSVLSLTNNMFLNIKIYSSENKKDIEIIFKEISEIINSLSKDYEDFDIVDNISINSINKVNAFNKLLQLFIKLQEIHNNYSNQINEELTQYVESQKKLNLSIIEILYEFLSKQEILINDINNIKIENKKLQDINESLSNENFNLLNENIYLKNELNLLKKKEQNKKISTLKSEEINNEQLNNLIDDFGNYKQLVIKMKFDTHQDNSEIGSIYDKIQQQIEDIKNQNL